MDHAMGEALDDNNSMKKPTRGKKTMKKMGIGTTIIWFTQWMLWKLVQNSKCKLCLGCACHLTT
jgi:hypothetical protein